jgi:hypothetical protein
MGYYMRGDYYRGDYYRGDLKGLFGKVTGVIGKAAGIAGGILSGGIATPFGNIGVPKGLKPGGPPPPPSGARLGGGPASGGAPNVGVGAKGYHLNKAKLGPSRAHPSGAAKGTVLVRNRHMHVTNPRALARASRRAHGFLRMARHVVRYYTPKQPHGKAYIGKRRGRSR